MLSVFLFKQRLEQFRLSEKLPFARATNNNNVDTTGGENIFVDAFIWELRNNYNSEQTFQYKETLPENHSG